jgi:hypothetical protein
MRYLTAGKVDGVCLHVHRRFMSFWLLAGELSNVLLNAKILMASAGYKGNWYLANGMVFTLVFGTVRVGLYGAGLWHVWHTRCAALRLGARSAAAALQLLYAVCLGAGSVQCS